MPVRVMSNPAQLLLAGNPRKRRETAQQRDDREYREEQRRKYPYGICADYPGQRGFHLVQLVESPRRRSSKKPASNPSKGHPVSKKKSTKTPAARAAKAIKRKQKRATRKKGQPASLKKYWAKRKAAAATTAAKPKRRRSSRKARNKVTRAKKRRSVRRKSHNRIRTVYASKGARVVVRRVPRGSSRKPSKKQRRRARRVGVVGVNAGALTLTGGITGFLGNAKATMSDGVKGFAFAFGGAAGAVAGGAFMSRITNGIVAKVAPGMLSNPVVARLLGAVNYYLPGWALSRFVPGLSGKSRRAMLTGAAAAALIEVVRPGMIRDLMVRVPVIGGLMGAAEDQADGVGAYVAYALSGGNDHNESYAGAVYPGEAEDLSDYVAVGGGDAAEDMGVGEYVAMM